MLLQLLLISILELVVKPKVIFVLQKQHNNIKANFNDDNRDDDDGDGNDDQKEEEEEVVVFIIKLLPPYSIFDRRDDMM